MTARPHLKDPAPFIQHGNNLETRLDTTFGLLDRIPDDRLVILMGSPIYQRAKTNLLRVHRVRV